MITLLAATRLMPREPARVEMRNKRPLRKRGRQKETSAVEHFALKRALLLSLVVSFQTSSFLCCLLHNVTLPYVTGVIKLFSPLLSGGGISGAIQSIVVDVPEPLAFTFTETLHLQI